MSYTIVAFRYIIVSFIFDYRQYVVKFDHNQLTIIEISIHPLTAYPDPIWY